MILKLDAERRAGAQEAILQGKDNFRSAKGWRRSYRMMLLSSAAVAVSTPLAAQAQTVDGGDTLTYPAGVSTSSTPLVVGQNGNGTVNINSGSTVQMNTANGSPPPWYIALGDGNGSTGTLNINGGSLVVNMASGPNPGTSIGRIWVGGGPDNPGSGTGILNMSSGRISFVPPDGGTGNYGALAIGRGAGVTGTINQTGGTIQFQTGGAVDLGTEGGNGTYKLGGNAVFDAGNGGMTMYIGSRSGGGSASTGLLDISGNAKFTMTTGENSGGQLYVGDSGATGTIHQHGAGSVVTLGLLNPITFGDNKSSVAGNSSTGTYQLDAGTLNVVNRGGGSIIFGNASGGTGNFNITGGTANIATNLILGNVAGSTGRITQTGGTLSLTGGAHLQFGSGAGSYSLTGGTLAIGGANGISGTGTLEFGNATLRVQGSDLTTSNAATLQADSRFTINTNGLNATWGGVLSGDGGLIKTGTGKLTLTAENTYTGPTTISGGTLALTGVGSLGTLAALTNNGTFDISGVTADIPTTTTRGVALGSLSGNGTVINGVNALVTGLDNSNSSFSGKIINTGNGWDANYGTFTKAGTGTLTINGATIQGGEAYVTGGALAQSGGTTSISYLAVGSGTGNTAALNVSGGNISFGTGLQVGDFGGTGTVTQTGGTVTVAPTCGDVAHCASLNIGNQGGDGTYTITGGTLALVGATGTIGRSTTGHDPSTGLLNIGGSASVSLTNGASLVIGNRESGVTGSGTITQTGGTLTVDGTSHLYLSGSGDGTYNLNGGTLQIGGTSLVANYNGRGGTPTFNFGNGTIQVIGSALTSAVDATLVAGTRSTIDTNGLGAVWSGQLSGDGALNKVGDGTLTLTGANSYTGGTTVTGGLINFASAGNFGSGPITLNGGGLQWATGSTADISSSLAALGAGGGTFDTNGNDVSFGSTLSGPGGLTKAGAGTLTFEAPVSYTGGTTVNAGALVLQSGATLASTGALTVNGGTFDMSHLGGNQTVGALSGAGGAILLGPNTLVTNSDADTTLASNISGTGSLVKQGSGILTLTGNNTYSGGTTVSGSLINFSSLNNFGAGPIALNGGGLQWAAGNTTDISSRLAPLGAGGGTFDTNGNNVTLASAISGSGGLTKQGIGRLNLTGNNSYTGPTAINAGTLAVNGSITSNVTVGEAGALGGNGTIFGNVVNAGTLAPGNSIGLLNVNGNYTQAAGSTYQVEVNAAGQGDRINVSGRAAINGGTVQALAQPGNYGPSTTYTILTAGGGVSGVYSNVTSNFAFLTPSLSYDANDVYLTLSILQNAFSIGGVTPNQKAVGAALDASFASATGDFATVIGALTGLSVFQAPAVLDAISGQPYADFGTMNVNNSALFMNALGQQMASARGAKGGGQRQALAQACDVEACDGTSPLSAWASALGGLGSVLGDGNSATLTYNFGGAAVGLDYRIDPRFLVGLGVAYTHGTQWVNSFQGKGWSDSVAVAAYGSFTQDGFYADALAGYGYFGNQLQRQIVIPGLQPRTANGSTGANQFLGQLETGYKIAVFAPAHASLTPFARLQGSTATQNGFTESGAQSLDLTVAAQSTSSLRTTFGADLSGEIEVARAQPVSLDLRLGWQHEFADTSRPITAALSGAPFAAFTVYGATPQRDSAVLGFQASTEVSDGAEVYVRYDGEIGFGTDNHALNVGMRFAW